MHFSKLFANRSKYIEQQSHYQNVMGVLANAKLTNVPAQYLQCNIFMKILYSVICTAIAFWLISKLTKINIFKVQESFPSFLNFCFFIDSV